VDSNVQVSRKKDDEGTLISMHTLAVNAAADYLLFSHMVELLTKQLVGFFEKVCVLT